MAPDDWSAFLKGIADTLDMGLELAAGKRLGFALLVFPFTEEEREGAKADGVLPGGDYVSNAQRKDMIELLRETADRLEKKEDIPPAEGSA